MAVERQRQQRTPANFGVSATGLSGVDTSSANFVKQGVVDKTSLVGIGDSTKIIAGLGQAAETGIKVAGEVRNGFQLADLESKQEDLIQQFIDSKKNPKIMEDSAIEASSLDTLSNGLWNKLGEGAEISDIDAVEGQFKDTMERYKNAEKQGVMSHNEFAIKSMAITREAINRNPALYDQIISHTKKVMGLSGMESLLKAEQASAENQAKIREERIKDNQTFLYQNFVTPKYNTDGSYDESTNYAIADSIAAERRAGDVIARQGAIRGEMEASQAAEWMSKFGIQGVNGIITNTTNAAIEMLSNPENKTNQLGAVRLMLNNTLAQIQEKAGGIGHYPGPRMALDIAEKRVNSIIGALEKFATNEDQANFLKNEMNIMRDQDNINVMKNYSPATIELTTKLLTALGDPKLLMNDTPLYIGMKNTLAGLLAGVTNSPNVNYSQALPNGKNGVAEGFKALAKDAAKGDETSAEAMQKYVSTIYADTKNDKFSSPEEKFRFYDKYMMALGTEGSGKMDMEGVGKASENLEEYMNMTLSNFQTDIDKLAKKGTEVKMEVIGDGRLGIVTSNPADTEMMVKKYGIRINNGLRAFSSLSNNGTKESADSFYSSYEPLKSLTQKAEGETGRRVSVVKPRGDKVNPPNESNPFNLIIPGKAGNFQKFKDEQQGIIAASKQLQRYQSVGNPATGEKLNTVREIAGIWNNEKEAGSASARTYLNTIVNNSKLDPDAKLDLNDTDTMVSLMFGMAKAEGNPLTKREIRLAVEGEKL